MIPTILHSGKDKTMETVKKKKKIGGCQEFGGERKRCSTEMLREAILDDTEWWTLVITWLSKPTECTTQRVDLNGHYGL